MLDPYSNHQIYNLIIVVKHDFTGNIDVMIQTCVSLLKFDW